VVNYPVTAFWQTGNSSIVAAGSSWLVLSFYAPVFLRREGAERIPVVSSVEGSTEEKLLPLLSLTLLLFLMLKKLLLFYVSR
jgi:hypothetical protein